MNQLQVGVIRVLTDLSADDAPRNSGPDFGKASPIGLLVVVLLLIGVLFLVRSMNRHLRNVPDSFDARNPDLGKNQADGSGQSGAAGLDQPTQDAPDVRSPDERDG